MRQEVTDILILGAGGAGLLAALHARERAPDARIAIAVKGLLGKCGCTRMVQGGYNVALAAEDSVERHFRDTIEGGQWLNDQDLAWTLVNTAPQRVRELENRWGCFFDRNADGTLHQKAFAGQTFDRTVHKGDLTGIEIVNRLAEQVRGAGIDRFEDHRAVALIPSQDGTTIAAVLLIDIRSGGFVLVRAKAVLLATGGGPTMYRYNTPSGDKSCDGLAMALRVGLELRDMEMVQFHPTGLLAGEDTRMTGTVLEEGLRGAGGHLLDGAGNRFMEEFDPRGERATRDIVSRAIIEIVRAGRGAPGGGVHLRMNHLGPDNVRKQFKGMVERCADCGFDLAGGLVEVIPTAHYLMGGVVFRPDGRTAMAGLFAAGEDTGGVHGANRLGGNGVANSTVFGGIAGEAMAAWIAGRALAEADSKRIRGAEAEARRPLGGAEGDLDGLRRRLQALMWDDVGILREQSGLEHAEALLQVLETELDFIGVPEAPAYNLAWHDWLNLRNQILVSRAITAAALQRRNSAGAHWRADHPQHPDAGASRHTLVCLDGDRLMASDAPVRFTRLSPQPPGGQLVSA
ncbi:MAG TPA: FAD-binding protein [Rhodospirillaceae bacterium]|nr:FAD-binding protein [Rhodospirillaceae bacterium]